VFLPFKPALTAGQNCMKASPFQPRHLLVRFELEEAAVALLREDAPGLQRINDKYTTENVFNNADLSPSAAKLAYENHA